MIRNVTGNLLQADVEALVNTVNCDGFMGKGIALQFKQAWPENFDAYAKACRAKEVCPGQMFIWETGRMVNPRYFVNFPTKGHWREKAHIEDIRSLGGVAEAALYCAHRTSTFLSCAFCEQEGHLAAPCSSF
jgi:O-acetyl-ADP-ribose deacetylase (regulator of RNase III)